MTVTVTPDASTLTATAIVTDTETEPVMTVTITPDAVTVTVTPDASTVTATAIVTDTETEPVMTVTVTPDAVTVTATQPVTVPVTLPASTVTVTAAAPAAAASGYSLGFGFDPLIGYVSDNLASFASVQDPANAYAGQSYLLAQFGASSASGDVTPQITVNVQPNTNYVADGYFKKGSAAGTCTVGIAVLNGAGSGYLNVGTGGSYHLHTLTAAYTYDSTAFNTGANTQVSVRYITSCYGATGLAAYYDNLTLHPA
ncbi:hypothetical protein MMC26_001068 [Xylographa opegraphella]|nr:hypothetical protein [Xylographa opegraphella]